MLTDQIKALFPLKGNVTQEIIDHGNSTWGAFPYVNKQDVFNCPGANTLKNALKEHGLQLEVQWGSDFGYINIPKERSIRILTEPRINMMDITAPTEVTFILNPRYEWG